MYWEIIYFGLCNRGKLLKEKWGPGSGLHRHHITPKHTGGADNKDNFTYLTVREHIIAHYLLWRIYKNPNDLRSMKMLGAKLTPYQRKITGEFCRDNEIGFFGASKDDRIEWSKKGANNSPTFQYWYSEEGRKERSRLGGEASIKVNTIFQYWYSEEGRKERSRLGGEAHKGKKTMFKPGDNSFIRVNPKDFNQKFQEGYVFGSPIKPNTGKKFGPSHKRKKVTDGTTIYNSLYDASKSYSVSSATIINWCKSNKKPNWAYV